MPPVEAREMRIRVVSGRAPGERAERLGRDEALGPGREDGLHLVSGPDEQADERARLVGRDPPGDSEQDARHPALAQPGGVRCLIFPLAISSMAIVR